MQREKDQYISDTAISSESTEHLNKLCFVLTQCSRYKSEGIQIQNKRNLHYHNINGAVYTDSTYTTRKLAGNSQSKESSALTNTMSMTSWIQIERALHRKHYQVQGENKWRCQSQLRADMSTVNKLVDRHRLRHLRIQKHGGRTDSSTFCTCLS